MAIAGATCDFFFTGLMERMGAARSGRLRAYGSGAASKGVHKPGGAGLPICSGTAWSGLRLPLAWAEKERSPHDPGGRGGSVGERISGAPATGRS